MTQFVCSLYRLYAIGKINEEKLVELLQLNKISQQEYDYIISAQNNE